MLSQSINAMKISPDSPDSTKVPIYMAIIGSIIHSVAFGELEIINRGVIIYSKANGIIESVLDLEKVDQKEALKDISSENIKDFTGKLVLPGFVDAHCHAPQYVFAGTGMDLPLLQWLEKYTFPCESRFSDLEFARVAYEKSVKRHLKYGTTFASYFATIHSSAARVLVDVITTCGQRAHVGKVSMDRNSPSFYIEDTSRGIKDAEEFVRDVLNMTLQGRRFVQTIDKAIELESKYPGEELTYTFPKTLHSSSTLLNKQYAPLVFPCVTPRFVPTCTSEMMHSLGQISSKYGLPVQSHLSESPGEIAWVSELHPEHPTYAEVYYHHGLLHHATYMAHCCHSDETERGYLAQAGCGVVHCASSNFMLGSGVMDVRHFIEEGIQVALGSDVAGGYSPSMLDAIRQSIIASNCCSMDHRDGKRKAPLRNSTSMPSLATSIAATSLPNQSNMQLASSVPNKLGPGIKRSISFDTRTKIRSQSDLSLSMLSGMDDDHDDESVSQSEWDQFALDMSSHGDNTPMPGMAMTVTNGFTSPSKFPPRPDNALPPRPLGKSKVYPLAVAPSIAHGSDDDGNTSVLSSHINATGQSVKRSYEALSYKEVYHLATQGGAEVLGMGDVVGNFLIGKKFDAIIVDVANPDGPIDLFGQEDTIEKFQKFLFLGDDRNIISVYVDGKMVM